MQRKGGYLLAILFLVVILIFYPIFFSDYIFTDEAVQLWMYKSGSGFNMFIDQGRWITEVLFARLFGAIDTVHQIVYIRLFSLLGWMLCIPVWYVVLKRVVAREPKFQYLPFLTCLYLITSLPFCTSVQWASCLELFLANTAGLLSGAIFLNGIHFTNNRFRVKRVLVIGALAVGIVSLFTYQSGFGCFVIPFLLHFITHGNGKKYQVLIAGIAFYFFVYVVYFLLYKLSLQINHIPHNPRTDIHIDPVDKILFFFAHVLERSFWFNVIFDENSSVARAMYKILFLGWIVFTIVRFAKDAKKSTENRTKKYMNAGKHIAAVLLVLVIAYLPGLVVKENYASNRTMLALNIGVWLICAEMVVYFIGKIKAIRTIGFVVAALLILLGGYNLRRWFLQPVTKEYAALKAYVQQHYHTGIKTFYFIPASQEEFKNQLHLNRSMDEFGVPSTAFEWVPEPISKQIVYEITGNRKMADSLVIKTGPDIQSFTGSGKAVTDSTMLVNMPALITAAKP